MDDGLTEERLKAEAEARKKAGEERPPTLADGVADRAARGGGGGAARGGGGGGGRSQRMSKAPGTTHNDDDEFNPEVTAVLEEFFEQQLKLKQVSRTDEEGIFIFGNYKTTKMQIFAHWFKTNETKIKEMICQRQRKKDSKASISINDAVKAQKTKELKQLRQEKEQMERQRDQLVAGAATQVVAAAHASWQAAAQIRRQRD
jgi:hypothetical protein